MEFTYTQMTAVVGTDRYPRAGRLMNDLTVSARRKSYFARVRTLNLYLCVREFALFGS